MLKVWLEVIDFNGCFCKSLRQFRCKKNRSSMEELHTLTRKMFNLQSSTYWQELHLFCAPDCSASRCLPVTLDSVIHVLALRNV